MSLPETSMTKAERIKYFDTTKGILMLLLIWGHLIIIAKSLKIENEYSKYIQNTVPFYRAFFMQTFFFITGFCTSWNIGWIKFIKKNLKTIVLPAFIFLPFNYVSKAIINSQFNLGSFTNLYINYIVNGIPWFLASLFIAKIIFYFINKNFKFKSAIGIIVILFVFGLIVSVVFKWTNLWSYQQACLMIPFMGLGQIIKNARDSKLYLSNKYLLIASIPYFVLIIFWQLRGMGLGFPAVDSFITIKVITAPFYLMFAFSGSALILLISKFVENIKVLNLMGQQSLFIYLTHAVIISLIMFFIKNNNHSFLTNILFFPLVYTITIIISIGGCKLMGNKYFSWMVGKT